MNCSNYSLKTKPTVGGTVKMIYFPELPEVEIKHKYEGLNTKIKKTDKMGFRKNAKDTILLVSSTKQTNDNSKLLLLKQSFMRVYIIVVLLYLILVSIVVGFLLFTM
jgi:hypothetical protein